MNYKSALSILGTWVLIFSAPIILFYGLNKEIAVLHWSIFTHWYAVMATATLIPMVIFLAFHYIFKVKTPMYWMMYALSILFAFVWLYINLDGVVLDSYMFLIWLAVCGVLAIRVDISIKFIQILSFVFIIQGGIAFFSEERSYEKIIPLDIKYKTNVYHYLNDGYAGLESLKRTEDFDNSAIYTYLEKQGFRAYRNPLSNYPRTYLSMTGYFRMQYVPVEILKGYKLHSKKIPGVDDALFRGCNETFLTYFKYNYVIRAAHSTPFRPCGESSISFQPVDLEWTKLHLNRFFKDIIFPTETNNKGFHFAEGNQIIEQAQEATKDIQKGKKAFTYLHSHPLSHRTGCLSYDATLTPEKFACMYENKNNEIKALVAEIDKADKDAIVILSSDHGAGQFSTAKKNITNRDTLAMFLAVRWNKACKEYNNIPQKNMHPVNVYKYVFGCQQGKKWQDVEILPYYGLLNQMEAYVGNGFVKPGTFYIVETDQGSVYPTEFKGVKQ